MNALQSTGRKHDLVSPLNSASLGKTACCCLRGRSFKLCSTFSQGNLGYPLRQRFGITFRNHHFKNKSSHCILMKFFPFLVWIMNFKSPSVAKSPRYFLEKNNDVNTNESTFSYEPRVKLLHFRAQFDRPYPRSAAWKNVYNGSLIFLF